MFDYTCLSARNENILGNDSRVVFFKKLWLALKKSLFFIQNVLFALRVMFIYTAVVPVLTYFRCHEMIAKLNK